MKTHALAHYIQQRNLKIAGAALTLPRLLTMLGIPSATQDEVDAKTLAGVAKYFNLTTATLAALVAQVPARAAVVEKTTIESVSNAPTLSKAADQPNVLEPAPPQPPEIVKVLISDILEDTEAEAPLKTVEVEAADIVNSEPAVAKPESVSKSKKSKRSKSK